MNFASSSSSSSDSPYLASSYRKIFGEPLRYASSRLGGPSYHRSAPRGGSPAPQAASSYQQPESSLLLLDHLGQASASTRANEKEQLQGLNDRFAGYIETVRQLEQHNRRLEAELGALRKAQAQEPPPPRLHDLFQAELRELRARLEATEAARAQAALERERLAEEAQRLRGRAEAEARGRAEAEQALRGRQREVEGAALARAALERKVEALLDELDFVRAAHAEEVAELAALAAGPPEPPAGAAAAAAASPGADLTGALKELRGQYEALAAKNLQAAEEWYRAKCAHLSQQAAQGHEAVRASREELAEYRRQLQARALEAECLRGANEALERQLRETEEQHHAEATGLQDTISQLENDLRETKNEMARHLREYQDLLNVKMALDIEIAAYRKLLEGEETRFSTPGISISSLNPISNPVYSFQPRLYSSKISPTLSIKKEKEEPKMASRISSSQVGDAFAEMIEETITSTKITEQTNLEDGK